MIKHLVAYIVPNQAQTPTSSDLRQFSKREIARHDTFRLCNLSPYR